MSEYATSCVLLSWFGLRREPPRPVADREPGYEAKYDADTLFFDVVRSGDGRRLIAPGAPLLNCESAVLGGTFRLGEAGPALAPRHERHLNGATTFLDVPAEGGRGAQELWITLNGRTRRVPIQPTGGEAFAGRRVLMTMSRDNDPQWLRDWATFHAHHHGTDALIVYDNASTRYDVDALRERLAGIDGIEALAVVSWPYRFGTGSGPKGEYDSSYAQMGAIASARWRFADRAEAVLFTDPDELVVSLEGGSVYDALRESGVPCLTFAGRWVTAVRPAWPKTPRVGGAAAPPCLHSDCVYRTGQPMYLNKWVASPDRCGEAVHWLLHSIIGLDAAHAAAADPQAATTRAFETRHCLPINTDWKYPRAHRRRYDPRKYRFDRAFARDLAAAFPQRRVHRASANPLRNAWDLLRLVR